MEQLLGGSFVFNPGPNEVVVKNTVVTKGAEYYLRTLFRNENILPANFYMGLTNSDYTFASVLADVAAGENTIGVNGYARGVIARDTVDFTVTQVNGLWQARSKTITFTASANWAKTWNKAFLANVASGAGLLFAVSGPAPAAQTVLSGDGPSMAYQYIFRG